MKSLFIAILSEKIGKVGLFALCCVAPLGMGVNHLAAQTIDPGDTFVRLPKAPKKEARVRLGIKLVPYQKVKVRTSAGTDQIRFTKTRPIIRNIRAQISKVNHFYIGDWHIEAEPKKWDKIAKNLTYQLRLYKRYGKDKNLEEYVGSMVVSGQLKGSQFLYAFQGKEALLYKNRNQHSIVELHVMPPIEPRRVSDVARKKGAKR
ncbi:MAG: hypothetical protein HRU19_11365 [Pseudobacteriovorax sp.]|nr:hypothetical protein [Pseudobacteriovorax sp.]